MIVEVDKTFEGTQEWYDQVAKSRPPKDKPWYHVLVDGGQSQTYVAERHLEPDPTGKPIEHPLIPFYFDAFVHGCYVRTRPYN